MTYAKHNSRRDSEACMARFVLLSPLMRSRRMHGALLRHIYRRPAHPSRTACQSVLSLAHHYSRLFRFIRHSQAFIVQ